MRNLAQDTICCSLRRVKIPQEHLPCDFTLRSFTVVHGNWGAWSSWEPCTVTCGVGQTGRHRYCDSPAPHNGGLYCAGESYEIRICANTECSQEQQPGKGLFTRTVSVSVSVNFTLSVADPDFPQVGA